MSLARPAPRGRLAIPSGSAERFEIFRDAFSGMFRLDLPRDVGPADFQATLNGAYLDGIIVAEAHMNGGRLRRDASVIARSGADPIIVQVYPAHSYALGTNGRTTPVRPGDAVILDLAKPIAIDADPIINVSANMARSRLERLLRRPDDAHGFVVPGRSRYGRLVGHLITTLASEDGIHDAEEATILSGAIPGVVAAALGPSESGRDEARSGVRLAILQMIRSRIDRRLDDPMLGAETLQSAFGLSRSSLYRLFEPFGGVARYIASRRLARIHGILRDPARAGEPIAQLAARHGYGNPSAFARAFRRTYGLTPSDLRLAAAEANGDDAGLPGYASSLERLSRWMKEVR